MEISNELKERMRASYNAIAPKYNDWTERHHELRLRYLDKLIDVCPQLTSSVDCSKKSVVELGCGSGSPFLNALLARAPLVQAYANELSDVQLDLARGHLAEYGNRVKFCPGDMMGLEFPPGSLTAVVALYSIIHLPQDEQKEMIKRIGDWLAPGGTFLATFTAEEASSIVDEKWHDDKGWMFWSSLGQDKLTKTLTEDVGLVIENAVLDGDEEEEFLWVIARKPNA
jgi:SAM-dependent methyltransferase